MADNPYTSQAISNYNTSPPADDGSETEANRNKWSTITGKLSGPLKTLAEAINSATSTAFGKTINSDAGQQNSVSGTIGYVPSELTISSGVIAPTRGYHTIDTEADAASDDLDTATPDSGVIEGTIWVLRQESSARAVTVKHDTGASDGKFVLANSDDYTINVNGALTVMAIANGADFEWHELHRREPAVSAPRGYLAGLNTSTDADAEHDVNIKAGTCRDAANTVTITTNEITKQIDANWSVGDDSGGFPSGLSLSVDTWYHVFLIRSTAGVVDAGFDTNIAATNLLADSSYATYRRVGSVLTDGSSNILAYNQAGDEFTWDDPPLDADVAVATSRTSETISAPLGIKTLAHVVGHNSSSPLTYISSLDQNDEVPSTTAAPLFALNGNAPSARVDVMTNTASQIGHRGDSATGNILIVTMGWKDFLGQFD